MGLRATGGAVQKRHQPGGLRAGQPQQPKAQQLAVGVRPKRGGSGQLVPPQLRGRCQLLHCGRCAARCGPGWCLLSSLRPCKLILLPWQAADTLTSSLQGQRGDRGSGPIVHEKGSVATARRCSRRSVSSSAVAPQQGHKVSWAAGHVVPSAVGSLPMLWHHGHCCTTSTRSINDKETAHASGRL